MNYYFTETVKAWPISQRPYKPAPTSHQQQQSLINILQDAKTQIYTEMIRNGNAHARPGVIELMDEAIAAQNVKVSLPQLVILSS